MPQIQKQAIPVFLDEDGNPVGFIFFKPNHGRIIFRCAEASEEEIIELYENKEIKK